MGHSQASKQATHERILSLAAERFCELGIDGLSIANLMKEAGLTHGGFYKHFESRDQLVTEALEVAFQRSEDPERTYKATFDTLVGEYLSPEHRDAVGTGCAVGALVSDIGRVEGEARELYTRKLKANIKGISALLGPAKSAKRAEAIVVFSAMIGALGLSRAVADDELSQEILSTVQTFLVNTFSTESKD
ncbi:TPA: TetR/AcrR family transcriptional regulator [Pseudomonas aeruginosa]|nr:TetR/AcrR family transcriptional regulator [Pseudomonas aeruginosa]HEJ5778125.1 TetR/AcrR family transcriptional regulator [Pseudomonas aeruginosa]